MTYRKKLEKIYKKINKIAKKGKDNKNEYYQYINQLVDNGDYVYFEETLLLYYELDVSREKNIDSYKSKSWETICEKTKSSFLSKLSDLYKKNKVYQISFNIYKDDTSELIGEIKEEEVLREDFSFYVKNKNYSSIIGDSQIFLNVKKNSELEYTLIDDDNQNISNENNLINRYKIAIEYLLS